MWIYIAICFAVSTYVGCAVATTVIVFHFAKVKSGIVRTATSVFASVVVSGSIASTMIHLMNESARANTPPGERFECCGLFEGGLFLLVVWLGIYSVTYVLMSVGIAFLYRKRLDEIE